MRHRIHGGHASGARDQHGDGKEAHLPLLADCVSRRHWRMNGGEVGGASRRRQGRRIRLLRCEMRVEIYREYHNWLGFVRWLVAGGLARTWALFVKIITHKPTKAFLVIAQQTFEAGESHVR